MLKIAPSQKYWRKNIKKCYWLVFLIFIILGCDKTETNQGNQFKDIKLPNHLNENTADLIVLGKTVKPAPIYLDIQTLQKFPETTFKTDDPWSKKRQSYAGTSIISLLEFLGIEDTVTHIDVIATNRYRIPIKLKDLKRYEYILAYRLDGELLKGQQKYIKKGSLIIAINFDRNKEINRAIYKSQLVWQVSTIIVK